MCSLLIGLFRLVISISCLFGGRLRASIICLISFGNDFNLLVTLFLFFTSARNIESNISLGISAKRSRHALYISEHETSGSSPKKLVTIFLYSEVLRHFIRLFASIILCFFAGRYSSNITLPLVYDNKIMPV